MLAHRTGQESSERRKRLGNSFPADNTVSLPRRQTHAPDSFVPSAAHRSCGSLQSKRSTSRANNSSSRAAVHAGEKQRDAPQRGGPGGSFAPAGRALVGARASDDERHDGNSMSSRHAGSHSNTGGKCLSLQKCVFLFPNLKQFSLVQIALSDRARRSHRGSSEEATPGRVPYSPYYSITCITNCITICETLVLRIIQE